MKSSTPIHSVSPRPEGSRIEVLESRITPGGVGFPSAISIDRQTPAEADTEAGTVVYRVTFDQNVTGVNAADFQVVTTGNAKADDVVLVAAVGGSQTTYDVTVTGVQGSGQLRLELVDDDSIAATAGAATLGGAGLNNGSFSGEVYDVLQTMPTLTSITRVGPGSTSASTLSWTVTFSERVHGVDSSDFAIVTTGGATTNLPVSVTPINGTEEGATSYTVTVSGVVGPGTVGLDLDDDETIRDDDENPLQTDPIAFDEPTSVGTSGSFGLSATSADLDGDGFADLVVANAFTNNVSVLLGNNDGTFDLGVTYSAGNSPNDVAVADFDGDGDLDLAVAAQTFGSGNPIVTVLNNNGDGTFVFNGNYGSGSSPQGIETGDFNGDGNPDIAVVSSSGGGFVNVLLGNGSGGFSSLAPVAVGNGAESIAVGDLDGDGDLDVVTGNQDDDNISVLLNSGSGVLGGRVDHATAGSMTPEAVALGDLNGDGRLDIVVAGEFFEFEPTFIQQGKISVFLAGSSGSFASAVNYDVGESLQDVALSDFNGDGILDVAVLDSTVSEGLQGPSGSPLYVLPGVGNGTLEEPLPPFFTTVQGSTGGVAIGDFDSDGKADLATANGFGNTVNGFLNAGFAAFTGEVYTLVESSLDLSVTINDVANAAVGGTVNYTFNYANLGNVNATGVTLTVTLDSQLNFVAGENAGWTLNGSLLTRTIGALNTSGTGSATLVLHVNNTIDAGYSGFGTTVTIADDTTNGQDVNPGNNQAFDFADITGRTRDLRVTDIEDPALAVPGRTAVFTISYSNVGNYDIEDAVISFPIPLGTNFNGGLSDGGWSSSSGTASITLDVDAGESSTVTIVLDIFDPESPILTEATISAKADVPDGSEGNDSADEETPVYNGFVVTAPGIAPKNKYAPPVVQVFDRLTGDLLYSFTAYEPNYRDSIRVATGDLNGDGIDDIVTTTQHRGGRMRFFDGATGERFTEGPLADEVPVFGTSKNKGAFVAVGNVIRTFGIDRPEIIVGSALISKTIGGGTVKVYSLDAEFSQDDAQPEGGLPEELQLVSQFNPFGNKFKGGVRVAVGDVDLFGNGKEGEPEGGKDFPIGDIIVGQGYRGNKVRIYEGINGDVPTSGFNLLGEIQVGGARYRGGVSVAAGDVNNDGRADVIVGRNVGKPSIVEVFDGRSIFPGSTPQMLGVPINPFDLNPEAPKNTFGVRVASADVNGDGIADIITSVGLKNRSLVKFFISNVQSGSGQVSFLLDDERTTTAYSDFLNVALWVAASGENTSRPS